MDCSQMPGLVMQAAISERLENERQDERELRNIRAASHALVWRGEIFAACADIKTGQARRRYAQRMLAATRAVVADESHDHDGIPRSKQARTTEKGKGSA